ncbi:MAG: tail fiber domain-containing protein [Acidobacteriia bacterium]|nr:tail fiber domain-containing protein [Terriglobia bacterium]
MRQAKSLAWVVVVCLFCAVGVPAQQSGAATDLTSNAAAGSSVPRLVSFSGAVKDAAGKPLTGPVDIHFAIYENFDGIEPLWFETQTVEVDAQGRFTALLGAMRPEGLPLALFTTGKARWLEVLVEGGATMPRVLLVSVPYAFKAGDAETLGGKPATAYVASDQLKDQVRSEMTQQLANPTIGLRSLEMMVTNPASTPQAITETNPSTFTCATSGTCVGVTQSGTGTPLLASSTAASAVVAALRGEAASTAGSGVLGWAKATTGTAVGVKGQTDSTGGMGIYGLATAATGTTFGVRGDVLSPSGRGVYGNATAGTGVTYGVLGIAASTSGIGLAGQATAVTGATVGIRAVTQSPTSTAAIFDNLGGGKLLSAHTTGFVEKFSVDGSGNLTAGGSVTIAGSLSLSGYINAGLLIQPNATSPNIIGGYSGNGITPGVVGATIGGGGTGGLINRATDDYGTVGGGQNNQAGDNAGTTDDSRFGTVAGGANNTASGSAATIAGGYGNAASGDYAALGGGLGNIASGGNSTVAGGQTNQATNTLATVGGGWVNTASGLSATIPGGTDNSASGDYSFAAGHGAVAQHEGAFVWRDAPAGSLFSSTAANQFLIRAAGGVGIYALTPPGPLPAQFTVSSSGGYSLPQVEINHRFGGDFTRLRFSAAGTTNIWDVAAFNTAGGRLLNFWAGSSAGGGADVMSLRPDDATNLLVMSNGARLTAGGAWTDMSDRNAKTNFAPVDGREILERLAEIPIQRWSYRAEPGSIRHLGPMAQDFYAAFGLGEDDKHIATVDEGGVALAGVQALYRLSLRKDAEIKELKDAASRKEAQTQALAEQNRKLAQEVEDLRKAQLVMQGVVARLARRESGSAGVQTSSATSAAQAAKSRPRTTLAKAQL